MRTTAIVDVFRHGVMIVIHSRRLDDRLTLFGPVTV